MSTNNRSVILRAFGIKCPQLSETDSGIFSSITQKLPTTVAEDRVMVLNQDDDTAESDLISDFSIFPTNIFATMMRIALGADDTHIDKTMMKKQSFSVGELHRTSNNAAALYKNHYYICFNNKYLVTTLSRTTTITRVENYLNWLIENHIYEINPIIIPSPNLKLSDIKTVKFADTSSSKYSNSSNEEPIENKVIGVTREYVKKFCELLLADSSSLADIDLEQIISAELILKLNKPRKMSDDDFQKIFGAILKPVSDSDNITFRDKNDNKITGADILKIKSVSIEKTDLGFLSEPELHKEMARFLDELSQ